MESARGSADSSMERRQPPSPPLPPPPPPPPSNELELQTLPAANTADTIPPSSSSPRAVDICPGNEEHEPDGVSLDELTIRNLDTGEVSALATFPDSAAAHALVPQVTIRNLDTGEVRVTTFENPASSSHAPTMESSSTGSGEKDRDVSPKSRRWSVVSRAASSLASAASELLSGPHPANSSSSLHEPPTGNECPVCFSEQATFILPCEHSLCPSCAVHYIRDALGDARSQISSQGIRCPMHANGCERSVSSNDVISLLSQKDAEFMRGRLERGEPLMTLSESSRGDQAAKHGLASKLPRGFASRLRQLAPTVYVWLDTRVIQASRALDGSRSTHDEATECTLSVDECKRLHSFEVEASIPAHLRCWCPECKLVNMLPEPPPKPSTKLRLLRCLRLRARPQPAEVQCSFCDHRWDPKAAVGDANYDEMVSEAYIWCTSKECPNPSCTQRISHFHGHACHHIAPGTGCPSCHQHFCYVCLRRHGVPGGPFQKHPLCRHGSSFCSNSNILANIVMEPYPHDRRCGCPICSHCRVGAPCEQCEGRCVVCLGLVPPGPSHLSPQVARTVMRTHRKWRCWPARSQRRTQGSSATGTRPV